MEASTASNTSVSEAPGKLKNPKQKDVTQLVKIKTYKVVESGIYRNL